MQRFLPSAAHPPSAAAIARAIRLGHVTCEHMVRASLERAAAAEPTMHAWHSLDPETAIGEARRRDRERPSGPLHGVPVAIKDLSDTADFPTCYGSPAYRGHRPKVDAACVAALRAAGAVILGKAATVEFGASRPCETTNPHNRAHTPGGSSAGSAAVVADLQVPLATGTQTGGSIIRPAAFCGVVGFKPTFGALSLAGTKSYAWSLDTMGGFARDVADMALLYAALRGGEPVRERHERRAPRIGIFRGPFDEIATAAAVEARTRVASACDRKGARVREIAAPAAFAGSLAWQRTISRYEMGRSLLPEVQRFPEQVLGPELCRDILAGREIPEDEYEGAKASGRLLARQMEVVAADIDVLLTFSTPGEAPHGLASTGDATFCLSWSLLGMPALNLPAGTGPQGLPVGVQLVALPNRDQQLLHVAAWVEDVISNI